MEGSKSHGLSIDGGVASRMINIPSVETKSSPSAENLLDQESNSKREKWRRKQINEKKSVVLFHRLVDRPYHRSSLFEYVDILYEKGDYEQAIGHIEHILRFEDINPSSFYIKLGKCRFRAWKHERIGIRTSQGVQKCIDSYMLALEDPNIQRNKSPVHYFELASMYTRIGDYDSAMEVLSTVVTLYQDDVEYQEDIKEGQDSTTYMYIVQYNMAQLLLTANKVVEAQELYQEMLLGPQDVRFNPGDDHACFNTIRMFQPLLIFEMARIWQMLGEERFAEQLLLETWTRMIKYAPLTLVLSSQVTIDFRFGHNSFKAWYDDPEVYKELADIFMKENNLIMAGEMYGHTAELLTAHGWDETPYDERYRAAQFILARAEILSELCVFQQAEFCAQFVYEKFPYDLVLVGRAANCCRDNIESHQQLKKAGSAILKAVRKVRSCLEILVKRGRANQIVYINKCATKITSLFRMVHVRTVTLQKLLSHISITHIHIIIKSMRNRMWRRGLQTLGDWIEIWTISANQIQQLVQKWLRRRKYKVFWRGIQSLKRIFKGQQERVRLRRVIQNIQSELVARQNGCMDADSKAQNILLWQDCLRKDDGLNITNLSSVDRFSSGVISLSVDGDSLKSSLNLKNKPLRLRPDFDIECKSGGADEYNHDEIYVHYISTHNFAFIDDEVDADSTAALLNIHTATGTNHQREGAKVGNVSKKSSITSPGHRGVTSAQVMATPSKKTASLRNLHSLGGSSHPLGSENSSRKHDYDANDINSNASSPSSSSSLSSAATNSSTINSSSIRNLPLNNTVNSKSAGSLQSLARTSVSKTFDRRRSSASIRAGSQIINSNTNISSAMLRGDPEAEQSYRNQPSQSVSNTTCSNIKKGLPIQKYLLSTSAKSSSSLEGSSLSQTRSVGPSSLKNEDFVKYGGDDQTVNTFNTIGSLENDVLAVQRDFGVSWLRSTDGKAYSSKSKEGSVMKGKGSSTARLTQDQLLNKVQQIHATSSSHDVISQISIKSVEMDASIKWVPFGILPQPEILRLLTCTVLILTSSSLSMNDSKRIARVVNIKGHRAITWGNIRSIVIYGTKLGHSGLYGLLDIGVSHLSSLSISHVGATHHLGKLLGRQLLSVMNKVPLACNLRKLYIEFEYRFGDRGFVSLLQYLQQNDSLALLSVRHCRLSKRSANALIRYIPIATSLEILILNDNLFTFDDIKLMIRAMANAGIRGKLHSVYLKNQVHKLSFSQTMDLFNLAADHNIRLMSDMIPTRVDTIEEIIRGRDLDQRTIDRMEAIIEKVSQGQSKHNASSADVDAILYNSTFMRTVYL